MIPTSMSVTASDVNNLVVDVTLWPGFHMMNNTRPFAIVAIIDMKMNDAPNIVVRGGYKVDIRVVQFMSAYSLQIRNFPRILIE